MTVTYSGTRAELKRTLFMLPGILSGRLPDQEGLGEGFRNALGFAALSDIRSAYIEKARGGTDEMGIRWPKLKPSTIARRRTGTSTFGSEAIQRRERVRRRETRRAYERYRFSLPEKEARRRAAIVGGIKATQETGFTREETLGDREVEILRDTSVLFNSLSPGELTDAGYSPPAEDGGENQIFEIGDSQVRVGTNVPYASVHQHGSRQRNIPARPFIPDEDYPVPEIWWQRWIGVANEALSAVLVRVLSR